MSAPLRRALLLAVLTVLASTAAAQIPSSPDGMRWREIGPTRAGRARALAGIPSQPNVFYAGFDDGGVWRSTDYGSTWQPLFDQEPTGAIGAIAVSPSNPNVIYVGSGAGIIRPDLAQGNGVYKSTDAGKTWTHVGLDDTRMIANIAIDPANPDRVFVAALGHPYGPNSERGVFRSTDGGKTWDKVLYKDEYTSANDVVLDPSDPQTLYAALWQQQQSFREGDEFGGSGNGIFKSTDGGTTWTHLTEGLPTAIEANLAIAPSDPKVVYAMVAGVPARGARVRGGGTTGVVGLYKSTDAGAHWTAADDPNVTGDSAHPADPRPLVRIGGGDLPTLAIDSKNPDVVYSSSTVLWRTNDGGRTWTAVRGAPGGDDYQKTWVNPQRPDVLLVVSDQGAVVSANGGLSWSNWYTQPTAAMYHVSTDDAFPYRVCGGQQDSGSGCVDSRSMDGEITFHDWHPVNIQEYGIAAPDPKDPDLVFGSGRTAISLYNRTTGQTTGLGPDRTQRGTDFGRNVRTMPINWSPLSSHTLFYASNVVWKSIDQGQSWTKISPDLTRQTWAVPANAGKYADSVKATPLGAITALSPSPKSLGVIWAGTDDGNVQVTTDGGVTWKNVTPPSIKPWTRIFNLDAGHFDTRTAYIAANTMRVDDPRPHFFRTHDSGATWTEIDGGMDSDAVANSIREDPRKPGLLYAATETQVWVSTDDGNHWESLRINMPAVSVRDLEVKDDSTCLCSDLIAATHGRGFWILDDVTPLRQVTEAHASPAYLFKPEPAIRVRFGTNDPTPWPPEWPAGENPPPGGIIDYMLSQGTSSPVTLEILDQAGKVVRSYSSADSILTPDPGVDPEGYDRVCQEESRSPDCSVPLYWAGPLQRLSTAAGMHRFTWDLQYDPVGARGPGDDNGAAVPHHTYPAVNSPWAPPGTYTVRLTVDGKKYAQPISVRLDPRVKTPALGLAKLAALSKEMYEDAVEVQSAYDRARALATALGSARGDDAAALRARIDSLAPPPAGRGGGRGGFRRFGGAEGPATLQSASGDLIGAAMAMHGADIAPSAGEVAACTKARGERADVMRRWAALSGPALTAFNAKRKAAGQPEVSLPR